MKLLSKMLEMLPAPENVTHGTREGDQSVGFANPCQTSSSSPDSVFFFFPLWVHCCSLENKKKKRKEQQVSRRKKEKIERKVK
jgi:hypothetical protein